MMNYLIDHALGECDMTPSQVRAVRLVLDETLSDLKPIKVEYEAEPSYVDAIREASSRRDIPDHDV